MILYFSATGNCKYVASRLAEADTQKPISIVDCINENHYDFEADMIGIVSPTYDWGLPSIVKEFLEKAAFRTEYLFFVSTYGTTPGASGYVANKAIRGRNIDAYYSVRTVDTWTPIFDLSTPKKVAKYTVKTEAEIDSVIHSVSEHHVNKNIPGRTPAFFTELIAEDDTSLRKVLVSILQKNNYSVEAVDNGGDALDHYFRLGKNLNQRDTIAVRRMIDGYLKLMYPDGKFTKEELEEVVQIPLEMRRRVKEQLKKLGGMEFYDVNFSYTDNETLEEHYVSVPEQGGGKLIPEGICNPGQVYTVSRGKSGMLGVFRLESQTLNGTGKFERTGIGSDREARESSNAAFSFLKANGNRISGSISTDAKDYIVNYQDLQGIGMTDKLAIPTLIALCSIALGRPVQSSMAVLGEMSISGTLIRVGELASTLQVCLDSGAKKIFMPAISMSDFASVPDDLSTAFDIILYKNAEEAVIKALSVG